MRVVCVGYREWVLDIYDQLVRAVDHPVLIMRSKAQYDEQALRDFKPDLVLFYGWSWFIAEPLLRDFRCLMLHPSPLPRYRGGSPLQNQIIAGERQSKVSIFVMTPHMDDGDIVAQDALSLDGTLAEIFQRMTGIGLRLTLGLLRDGLHPVPQDHALATTCKRRKPEDSEITLEELQNCTARYLHDKIRMLADPYPNAYLRTSDGKRLLIKCSVIES